jgi:predicted dehydrogenase
VRIDLLGKLVDEPEVRAGFIGCGSHSFRNVLPTFQFAPVRLVATCDVDADKARAFAAKFGADASYADHREMLEREDIDAVFIVTSADAQGRPRYPALALDCLEAKRHVWMEKPPATTCEEIVRLTEAAERHSRNVMVGLKKVFAPANEKAKTLMQRADFGAVSLVRLEYPQRVPSVDELRRFLEDGEAIAGVASFLDHLCHPMSLLVYLLGMPDTLSYERSPNGAGMATFTYGSGAVASLAFTWGGAFLDGLERTVVTSDSGRHIVVENNTRVTYHRLPWPGYGDVPDFYGADPEQTTSVWQPEFSLGQLYNKGLFLLGYYDEVREFARSILDGRPVAKGTLEQAWQITRVFEAFAEGPGATIRLGGAA